MAAGSYTNTSLPNTDSNGTGFVNLNALGQNVATPAGTTLVPPTQSTQGNNPINQTIAQNYGANYSYPSVTPSTLPQLTPTTTGSPQAQTNTVNPPVVANSNAASTDLNNIQNNANIVGGAVNSQNQANIANTNAQTQALNSSTSSGAGAGTGAGAGGSSSSSTNPDDQPITAGDLNAALNSVNGSGSNDSSTDNTGQVTTTTDANGNQIQSVTPPTEDNTDLNNTLSQIQQNAQQTIDPLKAQLAQQQQQVIDISNQQIQAAQDTQNQIQGLLNGTLPLSAGDQAQLAGIQATYNELISTAQGSAQAYVAGLQAEGLASGKGMYNPSINLSLINNATQAGISKVQTLTAQGAAAYAKLQSDLQNSDLTAIQDSYKAMSDALTARSTAVQGMVKDTQDAITQAYTQQQNEITDAFKSATLTDTEKQNIYNDALNNAKFTETQKQDITDDYLKGQQISVEARTAAAAQENADTNAQKLKDDEDAASQSAANALQTIKVNGKNYNYVDGTGLDAAAQAAALNKGIPVLTGDNAKAMSNITNGVNSYSAFMNTLQNAGLVNSQGQFVGGNSLGTLQKGTSFSAYINKVNSGGTISSAYQQFIDSFSGVAKTTSSGTTTGGLINQLQALGDPKITGDIISEINDNIPQKSDTLSEVATKMGNLQNALIAGQNAILAKSSPAGTVTLKDGSTHSVNALGNFLN